MPDCTTSPWADFQGKPIERVILLARTSGDRQEKEETIKTQIAVMNRFCREHAWEIVDCCADEACQNEIPMAERTHGSRLWRRLQNPDFQAIVVYTVDRWTREPHVFWPEYHYARSQGVRLIPATQAANDLTREGMLMLGVLLALGSYEKGQICDKFAHGKERVRGELYPVGANSYAYWLGGRPPYGYILVEAGKRSRIAPDTTPIPGCGLSPAAVVLLIFTWAAEERCSLHTICERLNTRHIPSAAGLPPAPGRPVYSVGSAYWGVSAISGLLHSPTYRGRMPLPGGLGSDEEYLPVPALVPDALWHAAQHSIATNARFSRRNRKRDYLLSGIIRCASPGCGYAFAGRTNHTCSKPVYRCGSVSHNQRRPQEIQRAPCRCYPISAADLEAAVIAEMQDLLDHPAQAAERLRLRLSDDLNERESTGREGDALRAQLAQRAEGRRIARRSHLSGLYTDADYADAIREIEQDERALAGQIAACDDRLRQVADVAAHLRSAEALLAQIRASHGPIATWPFAQQRQLVEAWVDTILVYPPGEREEDQVADIRMWPRDPSDIVSTSSARREANVAFLAALIRLGRRS